MQQKPWKGTEQRPPQSAQTPSLLPGSSCPFPTGNQERSLSSISQQTWGSPFHEDRFQRCFSLPRASPASWGGTFTCFKSWKKPTLQRSQENFPVQIPAGPNSWSCLSIYKTIPTVVCNGSNTNISDPSRLTPFLIPEGFGRPSGSVELLDGRKLGKAAWRRLPSAKKRNSM